MIQFLPLEFLGVSHWLPWKKKNIVYRLEIPALVLETFKFKTYTNEMTDDVINSTQYMY